MANCVEPICAAVPLFVESPNEECEPVYFSDFVVRKDSGLKTPQDLRGSVFAFNDTTSLSGYVCVRHWHAKNVRAENVPFFRAATRTGGHEKSLRAILEGRADVAAIDRCVRNDLVQNSDFWRRAFSTSLEVLSGPDLVLGPNPAQPVVVSLRIPPLLRNSIRQAFLDMDPKDLSSMGIYQWLPVNDSYYNRVREMLAVSTPKELLYSAEI